MKTLADTEDFHVPKQHPVLISAVALLLTAGALVGATVVLSEPARTPVAAALYAQPVTPTATTVTSPSVVIPPPPATAAVVAAAAAEPAPAVPATTTAAAPATATPVAPVAVETTPRPRRIARVAPVRTEAMSTNPYTEATSTNPYDEGFVAPTPVVRPEPTTTTPKAPPTSTYDPGF